jgi:hypothetical protein
MINSANYRAADNYNTIKDKISILYVCICICKDISTYTNNCIITILTEVSED